jgi:serine/threonine-protein kinase RsbW
VIAAHQAVPGSLHRMRIFRGELTQVRAARSFVAAELAGCPARETLLICVSELAANAIEHTASGAGGVFIVGVGRPRDGVAFVAVTDCGGAEEPAVRDADGLAEGGRGLALVAACSSRWGYRNATAGRTVWAEVTWPVPVRRHEGAREVPGDIWQDIPEEIAGPTGVA